MIWKVDFKTFQNCFEYKHPEEINNDDLIFLRGFMTQQLKPINSSIDRALNILGLGKEKEGGYLLDFINHYSSIMAFPNIYLEE